MKTVITPLLLIPAPILAGPYAPAANQEGTTAISADDSRIARWANEVSDYSPGSNVDELWKDTSQVLGPVDSNDDFYNGIDVYAITALGRGGSLTYRFDTVVSDAPGPDFAIWENSFSHRFLELAYVEVSSDGENFVRFPNSSRTDLPVGAFGGVDTTNIDGLAGKFIGSHGTPFDLSDLPTDPNLDPTAIRFIRVVDITGDGNDLDSAGRSIYDPYPTVGSAGFDLSALAILSPGATAPLEITSAAMTPDGFRIAWAAVPEQSYTIESSTDLNSTWTEVDTLTATSEAATFLVPQSDETRRFFRITTSDES